MDTTAFDNRLASLMMRDIDKMILVQQLRVSEEFRAVLQHGGRDAASLKLRLQFPAVFVCGE